MSPICFCNYDYSRHYHSVHLTNLPCQLWEIIIALQIFCLDASEHSLDIQVTWIYSMVSYFYLMYWFIVIWLKNAS